MNTQFTVDYFLKKFSAIPEEFWTGNGNYFEGNKRCAFGHCERLTDHWNEESTALNKLFRLLPFRAVVICINDGEDDKYKQPTPKQRILAALRDIKKMEESSQMPNRVGGDEPSVATKLLS